MLSGFLGIDEALQGVWLFVVQVCVLLGVGRGLSGLLLAFLCWDCSGVISRHAFASCAGNRYGFVWRWCAAHDASRASCVSLAVAVLFKRFCPRWFGVHRACLPNIPLKGTCRL